MAFHAADQHLAVHDQPVQSSTPEKGNGEVQDMELGTPTVDIARIESVYRYGVLSAVTAD